MPTKQTRPKMFNDFVSDFVKDGKGNRSQAIEAYRAQKANRPAATQSGQLPKRLGRPPKALEAPLLRSAAQIVAEVRETFQALSNELVALDEQRAKVSADLNQMRQIMVAARGTADPEVIETKPVRMDDPRVYPDLTK